MEKTTGHHSQDTLDETDDQSDDCTSPRSPKSASSSKHADAESFPETIDCSALVDHTSQTKTTKSSVPKSIQGDMDEGGDLSDY